MTVFYGNVWEYTRRYTYLPRIFTYFIGYGTSKNSGFSFYIEAAGLGKIPSFTPVYKLLWDLYPTYFPYISPYFPHISHISSRISAYFITIGLEENPSFSPSIWAVEPSYIFWHIFHIFPHIFTYFCIFYRLWDLLSTSRVKNKDLVSCRSGIRNLRPVTNI